MTAAATRFDPATHKYYIDERVVPSVTHILGNIFGQPYQASPWHLERGRAVHQACAYVMRGQNFVCPPLIAGRVAACKMFREQVYPVVIWVEGPLYHDILRFAGCPDLVCRIGKGCKLAVIDWKATALPQHELQLAGYAVLAETNGLGCIDRGCTVELRDDGAYNMGEMYDLKRAKQEWLSILTTYNVKQRLGLVAPATTERDRQ